MTYRRRTGVADIDYTVEVSSDLRTWISGSAYTTEITSTPLDGGMESVPVRDNTPASPGVRHFMRVRVNY